VTSRDVISFILDAIFLDAEIDPLESSRDKIGSEVILKFWTLH
jgi:hypothetical protein